MQNVLQNALQNGRNRSTEGIERMNMQVFEMLSQDDSDIVESAGIADSGILVEKRDGRIVDFEAANIINAVASAYVENGRKIGPSEKAFIRELTNDVQSEIRDRYSNPVRIDDIQNLVEHALINAHEYEIARAYTSYRLNRDIERAKATDVNLSLIHI